MCLIFLMCVVLCVVKCLVSCSRNCFDVLEKCGIFVKLVCDSVIS